MIVDTVTWRGERPGVCRLVDQTRLPLEHVFLDVADVETMVDAIRRLVVRGAPAIGVAAAFGVLLGVQHFPDRSPTAELLVELDHTCARLAAARPTAVNLFWALERMRARGHACAAAPPAEVVAALFAEARAIFDEDRAACRRMGELGAARIADGATVLTHCNAGALATSGMGSALAPIYVAHESGKRVRVYADETRPLLQGARLTAWELMQAGIDVTLITDGTAGRVMAEGRIDAVFVGSDRIARNGDVCNKIGTYGVAVLAREHRIPFYVVAPLSTIDPALAHGGLIPIEERAPEEVTEGFGRRTAPPGVKVYAPAFDVTPARLVTAIVTEAGIVDEPTTSGIETLLRRGGA